MRLQGLGNGPAQEPLCSDLGLRTEHERQA